MQPWCARRLAAEHQLAYVIFCKGARVGAWAESAALAKSAVAYNSGTLNRAREAGVKFMQVFGGRAHPRRATACTARNPRTGRGSSVRPSTWACATNSGASAEGTMIAVVRRSPAPRNVFFQKSPLPGVTFLGPAPLEWMDALPRQ
ncbi:apurinic/apyrimidinic endonuclease family protein [Actinacidiphila soli]|uniref:hypothetical protein n=1 Tax=Actinacidiphila soli TaxID=2487275 RepID=UPI000FCA0B81|nr:hypothetical protein [Actinacidiphila soli]